MREIILDSSRLMERRDAQEYIKDSFGFPGWYGKNLDALHDMLGELGDVRIVLKNSGLLQEKYSYGKRVLNVLLASQRENPKIRVITE